MVFPNLAATGKMRDFVPASTSHCSTDPLEEEKSVLSLPASAMAVIGSLCPWRGRQVMWQRRRA